MDRVMASLLMNDFFFPVLPSTSSWWSSRASIIFHVRERKKGYVIYDSVSSSFLSFDRFDYGISYFLCKLCRFSGIYKWQVNKQLVISDYDVIGA